MYRLCLYLSVALAVLLSASFVNADGVCTGYPKMYNGKPCASTTRYWDGTMGACGCGTGNDSPFSWVWNKPTAAASAPIYGSGTWCGSGCGKCFKLTPTAIGASPAGTGAPALTPLVVKVSNLCPYSGNEEWCAYDVNKHDYDAHFDLMDHDMSGVISSMGWNNPEVTYEEVDCAENGYTEWNCQCASGGATSGTATEAPATAAPATKAPATAAPTAAPTIAAPKTVAPTAAPTTVAPTAAPTTAAPKTMAPTEKPTAAPTTVAPTVPATKAATSAPTKAATAAPTVVPTVAPTAVPTRRSSAAPARPSHAATSAPTKAATAAPTEAATEAPTEAATEAATETPAATEAATEAPAATEAATEAPAATATEQPPATSVDVDNIKIEMNGGSNAWWVGFSVVNPTGNIAYVEVKDNDGSVPTWTRLTYQGDEYWNMYSLNAPEQMKAPLSLRITGVDGKVVIANNIISSFQSATVDTGVSL